MTIVAPGPGKIEVSAYVWIKISHTNATEDITALSFTTDAACSATGLDGGIENVAASEPTGDYQRVVPVNGVLDVASAGPKTIYLKSWAANGRDVLDITKQARVLATFHPA